MKKRLLSLSALALTALSALAQGTWTPPTVPASELVPGEKVYLYNKDAGGFLRGLGDGNYSPYWGTRAGVAIAGADTVIIAKALESTIAEGTTPTGSSVFKWDEEWDGQTYILQTYNPAERRHGRWDEVWFGLGDLTSIWVDRQSNVEGNMNFFWNVTKNDNGTYSFSVSTKSIEMADPDLWAALFEKDETTGETIKEPAVKGGERLGVSPSDVNGETRLEGFAEDLAFEWVIVSQEDFAKLDTAAMKNDLARFKEAMSLKAVLETQSVAYPDVDFAEAYAVFNNTASSIEELQAAKALVSKLVNEWIGMQASPENPKDVTAEFVGNYDFESNYDGWTSTTGAQNNAMATNKCDGVHAVGQFWENWNPTAYKGKMHKVVYDVPQGVYTLQLAAFSNSGNGVYLYANDDKVEVTTTEMNTYKLTAYVDVDSLDFGIQQYEAITNWMGIDNVKMVYYGNSDASFTFYKEQVVASLPTVESLVSEETLYNASYTNAYKDSLDAVLEGATALDVKAANAKAMSALKTLNEHLQAYVDYATALTNAEDYLASATDLNEEADSVILLSEYLFDEVEPGEVYPNGSAYYVKGQEEAGACPLTTEEVRAEIDYVNKLVVAAAKCTMEGGDVTNLLVNPNFSSGATGWTLGAGCNPAFSWDEAEVYGASHGVVDIYQTLSGVNPGLYSISVQAFERPDWKENVTGEEEAKVFLYMGDLETPVQSIAADLGETSLQANDYLYTSPDGTRTGYFPDNMEGARYAFDAGRYVQECYGLVGEDGIMKIGLTSHGVVPHWVLFDNFKLTFWGKNVDAMTEVLTGKYENATEYLDTYGSEMTQPAYNALNDAIGAAEAAVDAEDFDQMSAALSAISQATTAADENRKAVEALLIALDALEIAMSDYGETATEEALTNAGTILENYGNEAYLALTTEELATATEDVNIATAKLKIPATINEASDDNPVDMTIMIVNADFSDAKNGWSETFGGGNSGTLGNGYEYWNGSAAALSFDLNQAIQVLPAGKYTLGADLANSWNGQSDPGNGGRAVLYASVVVGNDTTGYSVVVEPQEDNADVLKKHEVTFDVPADAVVIVGTKTHGTMDARWFSFDNFTLTYFGSESAKENSGDYTPIEGVETKVEAATPVAIYNISGARVNSISKGINIVKMSDGSVKKVLVK